MNEAPTPVSFPYHAEVTSLSPEEARDGEFDVVVIGTGMGGGVAGRRLAEAGLRVLFVEKGHIGYRTEASDSSYDNPHREARLLRGLWPAPVEGTVNGKTRRWFGPIGCGVGGSSTFYAAALERPLRHDLEDTPDRPHPTGGWPVGFDAFRPHYDEAARLLHLTGDPDPLDPDPSVPLMPPMPAEAGDAALMDSLSAIGLHPYRLNLAIRHPETCRGCFGSKCPYDCKMDGRSAGVRPAVATGRAALLDRAEVTRLLTDGQRVTGLRLVRDGQETTLRAPVVILAAGALNSPRLLLASGQGGIANSSGWVGRGLMFHLNELFALWPKRPHPPSTAKSIALRDLATHPDRFGMVQSMGVEADYGSILNYLGQAYDETPLVRFRKGRKLIKIPAAIAARMFGAAGLFVGFLEDMPIYENRVLPPGDTPEVIAFDYTVTPDLLRRRAAFRKAIRRAFRGHHTMFLRTAPQPNYGHPAGTLRFGTDPATSVLDPDCRTHDLDNVYVADASFMPTSLGVNPSLTIAANALRVADMVARRHKERSAA